MEADAAVLAQVVMMAGQAPAPRRGGPKCQCRGNCVPAQACHDGARWRATRRPAPGGRAHAFLLCGPCCDAGGEPLAGGAHLAMRRPAAAPVAAAPVPAAQEPPAADPGMRAELRRLADAVGRLADAQAAMAEALVRLGDAAPEGRVRSRSPRPEAPLPDVRPVYVECPLVLRPLQEAATAAFARPGGRISAQPLLGAARMDRSAASWAKLRAVLAVYFASAGARLTEDAELAPERPAGSAAVETWLRQRQLVTAVVSERGAAVTILNHVSRRLFRDGQARVQHGARLLADVASL